jgi:hypothetical protein
MIRILDNNALVFLHTRQLIVPLETACFVPDEIQEEFLDNGRSERWYQSCAFVSHHIDEAEYLTAYAEILNQYKDISFYSLKGFGDVAIIAIARLLIQRTERSHGTLLDSIVDPDPIFLVSRDENLRSFIKKTFGGRVTLETPEEFARQLSP